MDTSFEHLIYDSDESGSSKSSNKSGRRKSTRVSMIKSESMPTRRSGRLQIRQQSADDDKDKSMNLDFGTPKTNKSRGGKGKLEKQVTLDDEIEKFLGATTVGGQSDGQLKFCVLLKGQTKPMMITSEEAKQKYPYHLLEFYESCLVWESEDEEVDCDDNSNDADASDGKSKPLATLKPNA